jgi:hypothetical protein
MITNKTIERKNIWPIVGYLVVLFIVLFGALGYIQVEIRTALYSEDLGDLSVVCAQYTDTAFKEHKVIEFNKSRGFAEVLCLYEDADENRSVELNQRDIEESWEAVVVNKINDDTSVYWPVYN